MKNMALDRSIDPNLFSWPDSDPALLAGHCNDCGARQFPAGPSCEACGSDSMRTEKLATKGTLWTWTIQRFMPKSPYNSSETEATFKPYGVGYLDLPCGLKIEGRIQSDNPENLRIGQEMEVVFYTHRVEDDGTSVINYAFSPV